MSQPVIVWFRQDLRLRDNLSLKLALDTGCPIIPVYIFETDSHRPLGGASRWWLHHSLKNLQDTLAKNNGQLILRRGPAKDVLKQLIKETQAQALFWSERYCPSGCRQDRELQNDLSLLNLPHHMINDHLLFNPNEIRNNQGQPFKVFTPFWKACLKSKIPQKPWLPPKEISWATASPECLDDWNLLPKPDWAVGLRNTWEPGEEGAQKRLTHFLDNALSHYKVGRDFPDHELTSLLSPHLAWGEISIREVFHTIQKTVALNPTLQIHGEKFLSEIGWREFCYHLLYHNPDIVNKPMRSEFNKLPWRDDQSHLVAWQKGLTGYPIVDAGMRQLWHTGWMHNRVRMIVASFLVKDLLLSWKDGEAWFWDTLVDADLANNCANWQWIAGCGADAAPFFRIFNPTTQGENYDPEGHYVRKWVPELSKLTKDYIHKPWLAPSDVLNQAQIQLGKTYPKPIVDHKQARQQALKLFAQLKS